MTDTPKASFVRDLEFSVRTSNLLSAEGITTRAAFMALDKPTVMGWRNAIGRTWKDIAALQETSRQLAAVWNACTAQDAEMARLHAALELALPVLEAAVSFERAAEDYLTESQYELNAALSDPAATIFVGGNEALKAVRAALEAKP